MAGLSVRVLISAAGTPVCPGLLKVSLGTGIVEAA